MDEELEALLENGDGLQDQKEVVSLCRLMVRVETTEQRLTCLKLIQVKKRASVYLSLQCNYLWKLVTVSLSRSLFV